jgi:hypothetical protein
MNILTCSFLILPQSIQQGEREAERESFSFAGYVWIAQRTVNGLIGPYNGNISRRRKEYLTGRIVDHRACKRFYRHIAISGCHILCRAGGHQYGQDKNNNCFHGFGLK